MMKNNNSMDTLLFPVAADWRKTDVSDIADPDSVAVIMRTKNRTILLARALMSVLEQSHRNWHLYIVNDGGNADDVDTLLSPYRLMFGERLTVIHNPQSLGMEAASNCALKLVHEAFVVIHDDDDSWHPDFLRETVDFLHNHPDAVAVQCNCQLVYEELTGNMVKRLRVEDWWMNTRQEIDITDLIRSNVAPAICLLIRTQAARTIGLYNESLPVLGDWDYNLRLFRIGEIAKLNKVLAYYHHRLTSKDANGYGNSVHAGANKHLKYQVAYRNALVRTALQHDTGNFGLLHLLMQSNTAHLEYQLNMMREDIAYLRRKSFPLKRMAQKVRDKIRKIRGKI